MARIEVRPTLQLRLATPSRCCWVADPGGGLWGWATAELRLTLESGLRVEITGLVVDDKARRRGVGRLLVEQIEGWAKSGNCRVLGVSSNVLRAESHAFYESLGYLQAKTQHSYRKTLA